MWTLTTATDKSNTLSPAVYVVDAINQAKDTNPEN